MSAHEGSKAQEQWDRDAQITNEAMQLREARAKLMAQADVEAQTQQTDPLNDELQAMRSVARTLEKLPWEAQARVVTWLCNRHPRPDGNLQAAGGIGLRGLGR